MNLEQLLSTLEQHANHYPADEPCVKAVTLDNAMRFCVAGNAKHIEIYPSDIREAVEEFRTLKAKNQ